jgi:hypothetical protein
MRRWGAPAPVGRQGGCGKGGDGLRGTGWRRQGGCAVGIGGNGPVVEK